MTTQTSLDELCCKTWKVEGIPLHPGLTTTAEISMHRSVSAFGREEWTRCWDGHPLASYDFLNTLETTGSLGPSRGISMLYIAIRTAERALVAVGIGTFRTSSLGEYGPENLWNAKTVEGMRCLPKIQLEIPFHLVVEQPCIQISSDVQREVVLNLFFGLLPKVIFGSTSIHAFNVCRLNERDVGMARKHGALVSREVNSVWRNPGVSSFQAYSDAQTAKERTKRHKDHKGYRQAGLSTMALQGADITPQLIAAFYEGYVTVCQKHDAPVLLTQAYYTQLLTAQSKDWFLIASFKGGDYVCGCSYIRHGKSLYQRHWSMRDEQAASLFVTGYHEPVRWAIEQRFSDIDAGVYGAHKAARGFLPEANSSAHFFSQLALKRAAAQLLAPHDANLSRFLSRQASEGTSEKRREPTSPEEPAALRSAPQPMVEARPNPKSKLKMLLLALTPGFNGLHLPAQLTRAGFDVVYAGTETAMVAKSRHLLERFPLEVVDGRIDFRKLQEALLQAAADRVMPLDEWSALLLQELAMRPGLHGPQGGSHVTACLHHSLGKPQAYTLRQARQKLHAWAKALNLAVPPQRDNATLEDAMALAGEAGYPLLYKQELSAGGVGTRMIGSQAELLKLYANRNVIAGSSYVLQGFQPGQLGMYTVVAEQGQIIEGFGAVQLKTRSTSPLSPSSVVALQNHGPMRDAVAALVKATGASGVLGWDFILNSESPQPWLIEFNPRPISISHLGHLLGKDLFQAWHAFLSQPQRWTAPLEAPAASVSGKTRPVALFPHEWKRDANSLFLYHAYHDVPWDEPEILKSIVGRNFRFV